MSELADARLRMAEHWLQIGRPEQALAELGSLHGDDALDVRAFLLHGAALHHIDHAGDAIDVLRDGVARHGPVTALLEVLGSALRADGRLPEAEAVYLDALSREPNNASLLLGYATVCLAAGQAAKAGALVERAATLDPEHGSLPVLRAQVAFAHGDDKQMRRHSRDAVAADPGDPSARALYGSASMLTGDPVSGYRSLAAAAAANPGDPDLREAAREARMAQHPLMRPLRPFQAVNPLLVWVGAVLVINGMRAVGLGPLAGVTAICWLLYCLYSWVLPPLLRRWLDRR